MKIKFTDVNGLDLTNIEFNFIVQERTSVHVSNNEGIVEFFDANEGDEVVCYIYGNDKHQFTYKEGQVPVIKMDAPLVDMIFVTIGDDEESVIGATVYFEYLDKKVEKVSDNTGQIVLEKIPVNTQVKVYQLHNQKEVNVEINTCKKDKAQYFIAVDKHFDFSTMKFKLVDKSGQIIRGADVRFKESDAEYEMVTDQDGCIKLADIKVGSVVECKQMIFGKSLPWHKFKCESGIDEYVLHGEKPPSFNQASEKYDSQVRMKFKLVNSKMLPIPNAVLRLEFGDKVSNKYTNQSGEAMIDDVLIGDKVKAFVDLRGLQVSAEFICQEDDEIHQIVLKTSTPKVYFWLIPLVIIIVLGILYANSDFAKNEPEQEKEAENIIAKDTVIISNYYFQIKQTATGLPLKDSRVKLIYNDTAFEQYTDIEGFTKFKAIENKLPTKFEVGATGYFPFSQDFKLDSVFSVKITKNDSVEIAKDLLHFNSTVQSSGIKTSFQSFKMNVPKGRFKIWANAFDLSDKIEVYNGKYSTVSSKNLAYSGPYFKGIVSPYAEFKSIDSIITVCIISSTPTASWVYKVYRAQPLTTVKTK